jgi:hypothetical protein
MQLEKLQSLGVINQVFKPNFIQKHSWIGVYKTLQAVEWERNGPLGLVLERMMMMIEN